MIVLADYNLNRQAIQIAGSLVTSGWLDLVPIQLTTFEDIGLPADSNDRVVWRFAQTNGMLLLHRIDDKVASHTPQCTRPDD